MREQERIDAVIKAANDLRRRKVTAIKLEMEAQTYRSDDEEDTLRDFLSRLGIDDADIECSGYSDDYASVYNPSENISYARCYNDGSVDTEITMTIPLYTNEGKPTNDGILMTPKVLQAFKDTCTWLAGGTFRTNGAGLHTALLFSKDFSYPNEADDYTRATRPRSNRLHARKLNNFKRAMTQLLPGLYFLASPNESSRDITYRLPRVSVDWVKDSTRALSYYDNPKYSAISYRYGALEFRVFDTCYDTPEVMYDNLVVIANCMKYMSHDRIPTGVEKLGKELKFGNNSEQTLKRFYGTVTHIDALNIGISRLKPSYYTVKDVRKTRKFTMTKYKMKNIGKVYEKEAKRSYREYVERTNIHRTIQKDYQYHLRLLTLVENRQEVPTRAQLEEFRTDSTQHAQLYVESNYTVKPEEEFVNDYVNRQQNIPQGQYTLQLQ